MKKIIILFLLLIPFNVSGLSMIAYEMNSGRVLYSNNVDEQRSVASISKIMTAIIACESGKLDDMVVIGDEINKSYGSGIYISKDEEMSLRNLVYGLMLRSGNDASYSIAKYIGGSVDNFVDMMNLKAKEIGMNNTIFNNPNGLEDNGGNISTAYDMAILTSYAMKNEDYRVITSTKKHTVKTNKNYYSWVNKNKLLFNYKYTTGGKTGFTEKARRTLVTTASNSNMDIVIVTLNDGNDFNDHVNMYNKLFSEYKGYNILKKGNIDIFNKDNNTSIYIEDGFKYPLSNNEKDNIYIKYNIDNDLDNKVFVYLDDKLLFESNVYKIYNEKVTLLKKICKFFKIKCK